MKAMGIAVSAAMVLGAAGVATVTSANASDACSSNRSCLYGNNDFKWKISERGAGYGLLNMTSATNDEMDSWMNRTTTNSAGYQHANGGGFCLTFWWGEKDSNVNFSNSDQISSWRTDRRC